jgi:hypothetical protein
MHPGRTRRRPCRRNPCQLHDRRLRHHQRAEIRLSRPQTFTAERRRRFPPYAPPADVLRIAPLRNGALGDRSIGGAFYSRPQALPDYKNRVHLGAP